MTKTSRSDFDCSEFEPLPEKFVMKGMVERFNDDFIETRRRALQRFLDKIRDHPLLRGSPSLKVFLTAQSLRGVRSRPEEFSLMQDYVEQLSSKICSVDKVSQRIVREQRGSPGGGGGDTWGGGGRGHLGGLNTSYWGDKSVCSVYFRVCIVPSEYVEELQQYSAPYSQWGGVEEALQRPLLDVSLCVQICSSETQSCTQHLSSVLIPVLHDYLLCADTLKAVMKRRDNIQAEYEAKREAMERRGDQEVVGGGGISGNIHASISCLTLSRQCNENSSNGVCAAGGGGAGSQEKVEVCNSSLQEDCAWQCGRRSFCLRGRKAASRRRKMLLKEKLSPTPNTDSEADLMYETSASPTLIQRRC
ncbi:hypothetical protein F7725_028449, partial [Dissostichus mawsoni]